MCSATEDFATHPKESADLLPLHTKIEEPAVTRAVPPTTLDLSVSSRTEFP